MHEISRTFLLAPSLAKWQAYEGAFAKFFENRDPLFDALIDVIRDFHAENDMVPGYDALHLVLQGANDRDLLGYINRVAGDASLQVIASDQDFAARLGLLKRTLFIAEIGDRFRGFQAGLATEKGIYDEKVTETVDELLAGLHTAKGRFQQSDLMVALRMYGEAAAERFKDRYRHNKERRLKDETIYYPLPWSHFKGVTFGGGDFITIPGYTSQCKSVVSREISYDLLVNWGLNVDFWTFEMPAADVENIFAVRHANNKRIFPDTPRIPFRSFREGSLTEEEEDFLFQAHEDLLNNGDYGTLYIEQPGDRSFNLADLSMRLADIEANVMPVHVLTVDYLSQMNPLLRGQRGSGDRKADINNLFADFRQLLLTHKNGRGQSAPLIGISPAQISRGKYQEALKNNKMYDSDAPSDYNEIERSSVIMLSVLMDREMRAEGRLRLQCLKNRMGEVPADAYEVYVALAHGMGISEYAEPDPDALADQLAALDSLSWGAPSPQMAI